MKTNGQQGGSGLRSLAEDVPSSGAGAGLASLRVEGSDAPVPVPSGVLEGRQG